MVNELTLSIRAADSLLFRDGRPFTVDAGARADTLIVPYPSTMAGFIRTTAGHHISQPNWPAVSDSIAVRSPLMARDGVVVMSAPADAIVYDDSVNGCKLMQLRPRAEISGAGTNIPGGMLPLPPTAEVKPARGFSYWCWSDYITWLRDQLPDATKMEPHLEPPVLETVHIEINRDKGVADEGKLYSTKMVTHGLGIPFKDSSERKLHSYELLCRVSGIEHPELILGPGTLGGERRLALVEAVEGARWPVCPAELAEELSHAAHVRMVLATPAIFGFGWMPQWLDKTTKCGCPDYVQGVTLKLVAAAVPRHLAVSGWEYCNNRPKPVRWMAPAGSVYFFDVVDGDPSVLADAGWLAPMSDDKKDQSDGFGLALWGIWKGEDQKR